MSKASAWKTWALVGGLAALWALMWSGAAYGFLSGSASKAQEFAYLSRPLTTVLEPGSEIRVEGRLAPAEIVSSPADGLAVTASVTYLSYVTSYNDAHGETAFLHQDLGTLRAGPEVIEILVGDQTLKLPAERWSEGYHFLQSPSRQQSELPSGVEVDPAKLAAAKENARGGFFAYGIHEVVLKPEAQVFVVGTLEQGLVIGPDPVSGYVEVWPGTQDELVAFLSSEATGLKYGAVGFICVGWVPFVLIVFSWLRSD